MKKGISGGPLLHQYLMERAEITDDPGVVYLPWVVMLPFEDASGFRSGVFELPTDIPAMLGHLLEEAQICRIVSAEVTAELIGRRSHTWAGIHRDALVDSLHADYAISGILVDYNLERLQVGDPLIGGYKSWEGTAEIAAMLHDGGQQHQSQARHVTQSRRVGLDLLGKPREQDLQHARLEEMPHGGPEFLKTELGEATLLAMQQIVQELTQVLQPRELVGLNGPPTILSVAEGDVFIDAGSDHGMRRGYRFRVVDDTTASGDQVPIVEVQDVISTNVSRGFILRGEVSEGQFLHLIVPKRTE